MKKNLVYALISYTLASLIILIYGMFELTKNIDMTEIFRVFLLISSSLFIYLGSLNMSKYKNNNKPMKLSIWLFFILYLLLLFTLTLADPLWGRGVTNINLNTYNFKLHLENSINIVPFKTIIEYLNKFDSLYSSRQILSNLLGNFIALMPMAFFLPILFKKQNNFKTFNHNVLFIFGIEFIQLITLQGRFDIDDIILNLSGALVMFLILKNKALNDLIRNIFLLEHHEINLKKLLKISFIIVSFLTIIISIILYRNHLYKKNLKEYNNIHYPSLYLKDETSSCNEGKYLFYEDNLYTYSFNCLNSQVFAIVNDKEKYLVKDLLTNNFGYHISINRILYLLDENNIKYTKINKYETLTANFNQSGSIFVTTLNENILDYELEYFENTNNETEALVHLMPKGEGQTIINVDLVLDTTNKIVTSLKYKVNIDNNLNVTYEKIED